MTSQLQSNGGTASPQTTLEFETTIEQCNEEWAKDYRSKWDSYPIQDLILEILARSCYYTQKNMHPTIKINFIEEEGGITLKMNWNECAVVDSPGWNLPDYRRFFRYINDDNREKADSMSQKHKGFRAALSSLIKKGSNNAGMIIYVNEDIKYSGINSGIPYHDNTPQGWYKISIDGTDKWHKMRWKGIEKPDNDPKIKTYLTIKLKDERVQEIKAKKGIETIESHIMSCFNKTGRKVKIYLNGVELNIKPLIPNELPQNNRPTQLRIITIKGKKCLGSIKSIYVEKSKHNTSHFLKITDIIPDNPDMIRNIEIFNQMLLSGKNYYLNMQPDELKKIKARKGLYKGQHSGYALNYHFIPEEYFHKIEEVIMIDDRQEPFVEKGPAIVEWKFAVSYYKNNMGIHAHLDRPNGVKGALGASSPAGISLYSKDIMINTTSKRWSSSQITSLDNNRWRPRTMMGKTNQVKEDKFIQCVPICEINQDIEMWNKESLYNCDSSLKNSSKLKPDTSVISIALSEYMWHTHLYELNPTWPQSKFCKANEGAKDEMVRIDQWNTDQKINEIEKLKEEEKKRKAAEEAQKVAEEQAEEDRIAKKEAEEQAKQDRISKEKAEEQAKQDRIAKENAEEQAKQDRIAKENAEEIATRAANAKEKVEEKINDVKKEATKIEEENAILKDNLEKVKAENNYNSNKKKSDDFETTKSHTYIITDPRVNNEFKIGWSGVDKESLKKQYPPRHHPRGIKMHAWIEINTTKKFKKIGEKLLQNRYGRYMINETEWFELPEGKDLDTVIKEAKEYLKFMKDLVIPL